MRLNLPRHNCIYFGIRGEFTVSKDSDVEIQAFMDETEGHTHDEDAMRIAFFGSRSRIEGTTHRVKGIIRSNDTEDGHTIRLSITNQRVRDTLPRPPAVIKPVSKLIEAAPHLFGTIEITCNATFEYDRTQNYNSKVRFPIPLVIQGDSVGLTHIEQAQFSRKVNDDVEYSISMSENSGSFKHFVEFKRTVALDWKSLRLLFDKARAISLQFITGESNVSS